MLWVNNLLPDCEKKMPSFLHAMIRSFSVSWSRRFLDEVLPPHLYRIICLFVTMLAALPIWGMASGTEVCLCIVAGLLLGRWNARQTTLSL